MSEGDYLCFGCGKAVSGEETMGSMKLPFCKKCFAERFGNDYDKFYEELERHLAGK